MLTMLLAFALGLPVEQDSAQKLYESGKYDAVVQKAEQERQGRSASPETTFHAAQALIKLGNGDGSREEYGRLANLQGDESWKAIGESGRAMLGGDGGAAVAAARRAIEANSGNPFAHYQLGLGSAVADDYATAAAAMARAAELKGDLAYAHYYAGLAFQKTRDYRQATRFLESFVKLAPEAPERAAAITILRTLK